MNRKFSILFTTIILCICTNAIFAASYPTTGYMEGPSYVEVKFIPAETSNTNTELLGDDYEIYSSSPNDPLITDLADPYAVTIDGKDYEIHDDYIFQVGDIIYYTNGGTTSSWELVAPDYTTYPGLYGYLVLDLVDDDVFGDDDLTTATGPSLGSFYDLFYAVPIGNGELILIFLILSYTTYILYKKRKELKIKKAEA